jgi:hypothetical protein
MNKCEVTIDGRFYRLERMGVLEAGPFGLEVVSIISELLKTVMIDTSGVIEELLSSIDNDMLDLDENTIKKLLALFMDILPRLDMNVISKLMSQAIRTVNCQDGKLSEEFILETWFQKFPGDYYPIGLWAIWENSKHFLLGAGGGLKEVFLGSNVKVSPSQKDGISNQSLPESVPNTSHIRTLKKKK